VVPALLGRLVHNHLSYVDPVPVAAVQQRSQQLALFLGRPVGFQETEKIKAHLGFLLILKYQLYEIHLCQKQLYRINFRISYLIWHQYFECDPKVLEKKMYPVLTPCRYNIRQQLLVYLCVCYAFIL
jgi:hypothetical protein